jgi:O-antigen biosynthesis protein
MADEAAATRLQGSFDRVDPDGTVEGWCWSPDEPEIQRPIAIFVDGERVGEIVADRPRPDLVASGVGDGRHGFHGRIDARAMRAGERAVVTLRDARSDLPLGQPVEVTWHVPEPAPVGLPPTLHGSLDRVSRDGWVSGWCWYPERPEAHVELAVLVDDDVVGVVRADAFRPDLQHAGIGDGTHGFSYALPYSALAERGQLTVTVREREGLRRVGDPITMRVGRLSATEERIEALEREIRLLQGRIAELQREADARADTRAARALFGTVAAFFADIADGGAPSPGAATGASLRDLATRLTPLTLAVPERPVGTVWIGAGADIDALHACIAALHAAGVDAACGIAVLDEAGHAALLPALVRNLHYAMVPATLAQGARGDLIVFLAPDVRLAPRWLDEIAQTLADEPDAVAVGGRVVRSDGLLQATGLTFAADGALRDTGHLAESDAPEHGFLRRVDALAAYAVAVRREAFLAAGGFSHLYARRGHAMADLTAHLPCVLYQPLAEASWTGRDSADDAAPPDLSVPDEETLRLRERLRDAPRKAEVVGHAFVVDDDVPQPDRDAGSIATFEQMVILRRLGWRVAFAAMQDKPAPEAARARLARHGIALAAAPQWHSATEYLQAHGADLDLVQVYRYANAAMLDERVRALAPQAKLVFATADLHFLREERRAEIAGRAAAEEARALELACMADADATIVTSDHEREVLAPLTDPDKLVLLRWIARPEPPRTGFAERHGIGFVGNYLHAPNLDGVEWFVAEVLPLVRARLPDVRLHLAGSGMPASISALASDAIEVHGWVPDLAVFFGGLRLSVAPLRYGAGFKGKVASSLAHGLPVVGSSISLEGTGLFDGDGLLAADDPAAFADAVVRLHEDAALWQAQSARALERVTALYSPQAATQVWRDLLARLDLPAAD